MNPRSTRLSRSAGTREAGSFLVLSVLFLSFILTLVLSTMGVVTARVRDTRASRNHIVARQAAVSGVHREVAAVKQARDYAALVTAFNGIDALDSVLAEGSGGFTQAFNGAALVDFDGNTVAEYDVVVDVRDRTNLVLRNVDISCYAYVPSKAAYAAGDTDAARADSHVTVTASLNGAAVFDYSYFINHWGWFFGNQIVSNGSVRSNGQFDFGGYASTLNGSPRYLASDGTLLVGYQDDNKDGVTDGSDGGAYSGGLIVNESKIKGMGALAKNQHEYSGYVPMPNLSDLGYYESKAVSENSSIKVGATTVVTNVLGDTAGEKQHVYLTGTVASPIVIDGPVVIRGSVILSGYVTGRGSIYAGGNVYVAKNLQYVNAPATNRPTSNDQSTTEAWRTANASKDALGLFAREHVVMGNYTDSSWQSNVSSWVNNANNKSKEDAGLDGIHNTKAGKDGILGTKDDDVLEADNKWTVTLYTAQDQAAGLIPAGKAVGDPVPGSGEDIDGDGSYDSTTSMTEFNIPAALNSTNWDGNVPAGSPTFASISSTSINRIDGALYTNHALAGLITSSAGSINMNGSIVSRNEAIIYSVPSGSSINMNHDERLSGHGGDIFGFYNPIAWEPLQLSSWQFDRSLSGLVCDPATVLSQYLP